MVGGPAGYRDVFPSFGTDLGDGQERSGGYNVHMVEGRRFGQFPGGGAFTGLPELRTFVICSRTRAGVPTGRVGRRGGRVSTDLDRL